MRGRANNVTDEELHDVVDAIVEAHLPKANVSVMVTKHTETMVSGFFELTLTYQAHGTTLKLTEGIDLRSLPRKIQSDYVHCATHGMCAVILAHIHG